MTQQPSYTWLQQIVENLPFYATVINRKREFVWSNQIDPTLSPEDVYGRPLDVFLPEEFRERVAATVERAFQSGETQRFEARGYGQGHFDTWYDSWVVPLTGQDGDEPLAALVSADATQRKHAELEQQRLNEELQHAQRMETIGQLAGGVAHDFNNLLAVISLHASAAQSANPSDERIIGALDNILQAAQSAGQLTRNLLAIGKKLPHAPVAVEIDQFLSARMSMFGSLIPESIEVEYGSVPTGAVIQVDPNQLEQILLNLLINARDAVGKHGRIEIRTSVDGPGQAPNAILEVIDDGVGMNAATMKRATVPFFTTKEKGRGSGLGLAMVQGLVATNGGTLELHSSPNKGTSVRLTFPISHGPGDVVGSAAEDESEIGGQETILVVEDEALVREAICRVLEEAGNHVLEASDGAQALKIFEQHKDEISLALLDVVMPKMGGPELCSKLLALAPKLKCLLTSGYAGDYSLQQFGKEHGVKTLYKPYSMEELLAALREALQNDR